MTDSLVWELMLQVGRIVNVHLPKDRVSQTHQGYGFVEFISEEDAEYAARVMNQVRLYGKPIRVNKVRLPRAYQAAASVANLCLSHRPRRTSRKQSRLAPSCSSAISTPWWMKRLYTTRLADLEAW